MIRKTGAGEDSAEPSRQAQVCDTGGTVVGGGKLRGAGTSLVADLNQVGGIIGKPEAKPIVEGGCRLVYQRLTRRLLPMASHGCSCCGPASRADTVSNPAASDSSAGGPSSSYQVTGLTCGHCAKSVTQALQALPQVDDVQVDLAAGGVSTVTVTGVVPPEMVRRAIEATGYTVLS